VSRIGSWGVGILALALAWVATAASAGRPIADSNVNGDAGMDNRQAVDRAAGDATSVTQSVSQSSHSNLQTATTSSADASSAVVQAIDGCGAVQSVQQAGRRNVAVQSQTGSGGRQIIRQSGNNNVAVQSIGPPGSTRWAGDPDTCIEPSAQE